MTTWSARVEWDPPKLDADKIEQHLLDVHERLYDYRASVGFEEARDSAPDVASAHLTVEAGTLREAIDEALRAVRDAVHAAGQTFTPTGLEVLPTVVHDARDAHPAIPYLRGAITDLPSADLVGYAEIAEILGVSRQRARQLANEHDDFPPALVTTKAGPLRARAHVEAWSKRRRRPGRPPAPTADPRGGTYRTHPVLRLVADREAGPGVYWLHRKGERVGRLQRDGQGWNATGVDAHAGVTSTGANRGVTTAAFYNRLEGRG